MANEFRRPIANLRAIGKQLDNLRSVGKRVDVGAEKEFYKGIASKIIFEEIERIRSSLGNPDNSPERRRKLMKAYGEFVKQGQSMGLGRRGTSADYQELGSLYDIAKRSYEDKNLNVANQSLERAVQIIDSGMNDLIFLRKEARELIRNSESPGDREYSERFFERLNEELAETIGWDVELGELQGKVQRDIELDNLRKLRLRNGMATKVAAGALIPLLFLGAGAYLFRDNIASRIAGPQPAAVEPIDYSPHVIIANGVGSERVLEKDQIRNLENAFEAYRLYSPHIKTDLFASNPYNIPIPGDVKVAGMALKEDIINAIRKSHGRTSIILLSPEKRYSVGSSGAKVESDAYFSVLDGTIFSREIVEATMNNSSDFLITNIPNWQFINGIFQYDDKVGRFRIRRPDNLTAIMLNENASMSDVRKRFGQNNAYSIEDLFAPYIEKGIFVNQFEQTADISQSPLYRAPLFPLNKD